MENKILFTDLDGTLLNSQKQVSEENKKAIDEARALGHAVVISTGRVLPSVKKQAKKLGLTDQGCYAITANGGLIYDIYEDKTLYKTSLPADCLKYVLKEAAKYDIHAQAYDDDYVLVPSDNEHIQHYSKMADIPYKVIPDLADTISEPSVKILLIDLHDHEKLVRFRDHMEEYCAAHDIDMMFSCLEYLEFIPKGVSKGSGVRYLCSLLNIPLENSYAAGDAENDIAMLEAAGTACVMANASDDMKKYGDYITEADNEHSGVAEIIRKFFLV